jgi:hypothetical protein
VASLNRTQLATLLGTRAGVNLRAVGLTTADSTGNLKEPLDDTLRALGVPYGSEASATLDDGRVAAFLAVGAVYVLRRALDEASGFADVAATALGTSKSKNQIVKNLRERLADAEAHAMQYGIADLVPAMGSGVYTIDALEPEEVA